MYAATQGRGVFKSEDAGKHWQSLASSPRYVNELVIDPRVESTLYAATFGVSKSTDGGRTWFEANTGFGEDAYPPQIVSLMIDPEDTATLWVSTLSEGMFRSDDGGATWFQLDPDSPYSSYYRVGANTFAVHPTERDTLLIGGWGVRRSSDRGATWDDRSALSR